METVKLFQKLLQRVTLPIIFWVVFIICFGVYSYGQSWEVITETPSADFKNGLRIYEDGLHGMAVGDGLVLTTSNGGENWEIVTPIPEGAPNAIYMLTPDSVWAVFTSGMIYATSDGGQTWVNQPSGTTRRLFDVQFIDHLNGWAVGGWSDGSTYLVLRTTNGGQTWVNQSFGSASSPTIQAVFFIDAQTGWICGKADGLPFVQKTTDGGASWVNQVLPSFTGTGKSCNDIDFASADIGWATTDRNNQDGAVIHTTDGGTTWTIQTTTDCDLNRIDVQDAQHVALMCRDNGSTGQKIVKITTDGGTTWTTNNSPTFSYNISYVGSSIWIGAEIARILRSSDFGANWDYQFQSYYLQSVDWIDNNSAWIVSKFSEPTGLALRTDDGGSNWFEDEDTPGGNWVFVLDSNTAWIMIQGSPLTAPAILYRTTDGGVNWATSTLPAGYIDGFTWVTANLGWAFGGSGNIRHTTDGGVTWVAQYMNIGIYIADVHFINALEGWACGGYAGENAFIRHTTDGGATWTVQDPTITPIINDIYFFDSSNGMAVADDGLVLRTSNGGATWSVISTIANEDLDVLVMLNSTTGWATGSSIYRTDDGGQSWTLDWSPTPIGGAIISMALNPAGNSLMACGSSNTILRYQLIVPVELISFNAVTNGSSVTLSWNTATETNNQGFEVQRKLDNSEWTLREFKRGVGTTTEPQTYLFVDDISNLTSNSISYRLKQIDFDGTFTYSSEIEVEVDLAPSTYSLSQNYPNPFNPTTIIAFGVPIKSQVTLQVFNSIGELVALLVNEEKPAGTYELTWYAEGLPSGIYFYKLQAGSFIETKKMILLK